MACRIAVLLIAACPIAFAQDSDQPEIPLGDVPRQTRPQGEDTSAKSNRAQQIVDEMQQEQEASENAPLGFTNYDAGEYRLFVPYPYTLEGRENGGAVLVGSRLGITNTEVLAGTPIQVPNYVTEQYRLNYIRQLASQYGATYCSQIQNAGRAAFRCGFQNTSHLLGHQVRGSMEHRRWRQSDPHYVREPGRATAMPDEHRLRPARLQQPLSLLAGHAEGQERNSDSSSRTGDHDADVRPGYLSVDSIEVGCGGSPRIDCEESGAKDYARRSPGRQFAFGVRLATNAGSGLSPSDARDAAGCASRRPRQC